MDGTKWQEWEREKAYTKYANHCCDWLVTLNIYFEKKKRRRQDTNGMESKRATANNKALESSYSKRIKFPYENIPVLLFHLLSYSFSLWFFFSLQIKDTRSCKQMWRQSDERKSDQQTTKKVWKEVTVDKIFCVCVCVCAQKMMIQNSGFRVN